MTEAKFNSYHEDVKTAGKAKNTTKGDDGQSATSTTLPTKHAWTLSDERAVQTSAACPSTVVTSMTSETTGTPDLFEEWRIS